MPEKSRKPEGVGWGESPGCLSNSHVEGHTSDCSGASAEAQVTTVEGRLGANTPERRAARSQCYHKMVLLCEVFISLGILTRDA